MTWSSSPKASSSYLGKPDQILRWLSDRFFEDLESKFGDFKGKTLIFHFTFDKDLETREMHPPGEEFVCLLCRKYYFSCVTLGDRI